MPAQDASRLAGVPLAWPALVTNMGGCINTSAMIESLIDHPHIQLRTDAEVAAITPTQTTATVELQSGPEDYDAVVLATGGADPLSEGFGVCDVERIRGQVTLVDGKAFKGQRRLLCFKGYLTRANDAGQHVTGASFDHAGDPHDREPIDASDAENLERLNAVLPGSYRSSGGWVGWRRVARDRLPLVGPLPDYAWFRDSLGPWTQGGAPGPCPAPRYVPGVWLSLAHASRGTGTAIICGELVAAGITGDALPLPTPLVHALHPARFVIRALKSHQA
mgnify:CR=1 FL=1